MNECQKGKDQGERVKVMRNFFRLQIRYKWNNVWEWLRTMKKNKIAAKQNRKWIRRNSEIDDEWCNIILWLSWSWSPPSSWFNCVSYLWIILTNNFHFHVRLAIFFFAVINTNYKKWNKMRRLKKFFVIGLIIMIMFVSMIKSNKCIESFFSLSLFLLANKIGHHHNHHHDGDETDLEIWFCSFFLFYL